MKKIRPSSKLFLETLEDRQVLFGGALVGGGGIGTDDPLEILPGPALEMSGGAMMALMGMQYSNDPGISPGSGELPNAPGLSTTFGAVNFDQNGTLNGGGLSIPPDSSGAAGTASVVNVVNTSIQIFNKSGGNIAQTSLSSFYASLGPILGAFDPKVMYDHFSNRFVVVTLDGIQSATQSRILVAASRSATPTTLTGADWIFRSIASNVTIGGNSHWADYPGIGLDEEAIYITNNMFLPGGGTSNISRLWIMNKSQLYSDATTTTTLHDHFTSAGIGQGGTTQPAMMMQAGPGTVGTWLTSAGWASGSTDFLSVIRINNPLSSPTFTNTFINLGNPHLNPSLYFGAPQSGTATRIDTGDVRMQNAVWRNNNLYAVNTILQDLNSNGVNENNIDQEAAHWYRINADASTVSLADQGDIGGEDIAVGTRTFYPAIAVDQNNNVAVSFSASAPSIFAGAYYTARLATDSAGTMQAASVLRAGTDFYVRTFGSGRNRWGDYSGLSVDPSDGVSFWAFNQYAMTRGTILGGEDGRWATQWGRFAFAPEVAVVYDGVVAVADNTGTANFGTSVTNAAVSKTFTISNTGGANLILQPASTTGPFTVTTNFAANQVVAPGGTATLIVRMNASSTTGTQNGTITFANNDSDENPYNFNLTGIVKQTLRVTDVRAYYGSQSTSILSSFVGGAITLPWFNVTGIEITFSESGATVDGADATLLDTVSNTTIGLSFSSTATTARWNFAGLSTPRRLRFTVDGDGTATDGNAGITDSLGFLMDGNSDGVIGDDFIRTVNILPGDTNGDGVVNSQDLVKARSNSPAFGGTFNVFSDVDGDGDVDINDINLVRSRLGSRLP